MQELVTTDRSDSHLSACQSSYQTIVSLGCDYLYFGIIQRITHAIGMNYLYYSKSYLSLSFLSNPNSSHESCPMSHSTAIYYPVVHSTYVTVTDLGWLVFCMFSNFYPKLIIAGFHPFHSFNVVVNLNPFKTTSLHFVLYYFQLTSPLLQ